MTTAIIAERGVGGYRQFRIPALAAAGPTVLCAYDARLNLDDLPAPIDLLLRRSEDGGRAWSPPQSVRTGTGFEGFGDPSLLTDPATGRVLLFHSATVYAGFFESGDALCDADPHVQHADLSISEDGGFTWRHIRLSTALRSSGNAHFPGERISGLFAASGAGCAIPAGPYAGRLVQPYVLRVNGRVHVACALSDDHGETWRLGSPVPVADGAELNESSVTALPSGTLVLHSRGVGARLQAFSDDGGESFSPAVAVPELVDSGTNGSVIAVGSALFASHTADPDLRRRAVISRSDDDGATWREIILLEPGAAGYSQLVPLPGGAVGAVHEAEGYQRIVFKRFAAKDLRGPAMTPPDLCSAPRAAPGWERRVAGELVQDVVLRSITPPSPAAGIWPTHEIDLTGFAHVPTTVFKEIGADRAQTSQVIHTREGLRSSGQITPGIGAGETLTFHARLRNRGTTALTVTWEGVTRTLGPAEVWVRRDIRRLVDSRGVLPGVPLPRLHGPGA